MKKILLLIPISAALFCAASCETYKVDEPDMTAIHQIDGKFVGFAYENGAATASTVFAIQITNTTDDDADRAWVTITDTDPSRYEGTNANVRVRYLDAIRFEVSVNIKSQTFSATNVSATEPRTAWNPYMEGWYGSYGSYYTEAYRTNNFQTYTVSVDGRVVTDGVNTKTGYKADSIEFTYSRTYPDGTVKSYTVRGMKRTGWVEDMQDYEDFINENYLN